MKKYSDVISGAILFILSTAYYVMALDIKQFNAGQTGIVTSDFMPKIYGAAVMLLSALLIVRGIRNIKKAAGLEDEVETGGRKFFVQLETLLVFLLLIVYVALLPTAGFIIMSILFVMGLSCLLLPKEKHGPKTYLAILAVATVFTVAITLIFVKGFSLTLPMGIFW